MGMYTIHLFAGAGGGILADKLLGHTSICAVEIESYPRRVLLQRQLDGILPVFPIWDDVRTFRADNPETADFFQRARSISNLTICGGFPCQDISSAGKGAGLSGDRSGLWFEYLRIVEEIRPRFVFAENSPLLRTRGLGTVIKGLAELGYDVRWCVLGACDIGANHRRTRIWILGRNSDCGECNTQRAFPDYSSNASRDGADVPDSAKQRLEGAEQLGKRIKQQSGAMYEGWWACEPALDRVANGVANRVDRIKAIGNGQVSGVAALAWNILTRIGRQT